MMPPGGADARADQFEALERIVHDRITDPRLGKLLDALEPFADQADPESDDAALIRNLRRDHHKAVNVSTDLAAEISSANAHAQQAWMAAREKADFALFQPALERILELTHRYIACFDGTGEFAHPYDVLLDDYEPSLTTEELQDALRHDPGGARPARLGRRGGRRGRPRVPGPLPAGEPAGARRGAAPRRRLRPRALAPGPLRPPVRAQHGPHGRPPDHALGGGRPGDGGLQLPARVRPRPLRGADGPAPLPDDAGRGDGPRRARVPVAAVGEPRRPLRAVLRVRAPAPAQAPRRSVRGDRGPRALPQRQPGPAQPDPHRGRRDDVQPAHRAALRARARAGRGPARRQGPARRVERGDPPPARPRDAVAQGGRAAGHPLGHGDDRLLPDLHDREPDGRPAVARARRPTCRRSTRASPPATSPRCASGCATTSTATAASSPRASCSSGSRGRSCGSSRSSPISRPSCWTPGC